MAKNIAVIGGSGAIGSAFVERLAALYGSGSIHVFSRSGLETNSSNLFRHTIDYDDETSIEAAALLASRDAPLDIVLIATGLLHEDGVMPEKSLRELSAEKFQRLFAVNTILPALIAKHFLPKLNRDHPSIFAALSARVGSISDNRLGGWYAYRASKAALNMVIKNAAIEMSRGNKQAIIVGLHPGTVDSGLSKPFQENVPEGKLFSPDFSAKSLLDVLAKLTPLDSGKCFDWDGREIQP